MVKLWVKLFITKVYDNFFSPDMVTQCFQNIGNLWFNILLICPTKLLLIIIHYDTLLSPYSSFYLITSIDCYKMVRRFNFNTLVIQKGNINKLIL